MTLLCIGRSGQVARALAECAAARAVDLVCLGRPELDLLDPKSVARAMDQIRPSFVINAAAYTNVDGAETEQDEAFALNAEAPGLLADLCARKGLPLLHLSTDYVFDGQSGQPYLETDETAPINVYGASKLAGEAAIAARLSDHIILRTSWVYSPFGANFAKTMLRLAKERGGASVVDDQTGTPTSAFDIAETILDFCQNLKTAPDPGKYGIYHFVAAGFCSWADFADLVFSLFDAHTGCTTDLQRIPSSAYPTPAERPMNSRLATQKISTRFGVCPRDWTIGVTETVTRLLQEEAQ